MGCCECHDHKFDPFTRSDFYSLGAFFADVKQWGVYTDYGYTPNPDLKGLTNDHPFPPEIEVDSPYLRGAASGLSSRSDQIVADVCGERTAKPPPRPKLRSLAGGDHGIPLASARRMVDVIEARRQAKPKAAAKPRRIGRSTFTGQGRRNRIASSMPRPSQGTVAAIRLELLPANRTTGAFFAGEWDTPRSSRSRPRSSAAEGQEKRLNVYFADADDKRRALRQRLSVLGVQSGWKTRARDGEIAADRGLPAGTDLRRRRPAITDRDASTRNAVASAASFRVSPSLRVEPIDHRLCELLAKRRSRGTATRRAATAPGCQRLTCSSTTPIREALSEIRELHQQVVECRGGQGH